jgi:hypothetical protein
MLLGEKVKFQQYFFWVSAKSGGGKIGNYQFPPASTRTIRGKTFCSVPPGLGCVLALAARYNYQR